MRGKGAGMQMRGRVRTATTHARVAHTMCLEAQGDEVEGALEEHASAEPALVRSPVSRTGANG